MRLYYFDGLTLAQIGDRMGCTLQYCQQQKSNAMRQLRRSRQLEAFLDARTDWYREGGLKRFKQTGTSSVEAAALWREQMRERWGC